jgi:7-cyano-7-deazaguanine synthase in queuosine biosynthesis
MTPTRRALVSIDGKADKNAGLVLVPGLNLNCGDKDFKAAFGEPTSLEADLLRVSAAVFACDLAFQRGQRENIIRTIELAVPVVNSQAFDRVRRDLESILYVLSHDNWTVNFKRMKGPPEEAMEWPQSNGKTLLFSGGLDSFAAAVDLLDQLGSAGVQLVSHVTGNQLIRGTQEALAAYLEKAYATDIKRVAVRTGGRKRAQFDFPSDQDREETQRTRSFMFLAIAALAARRSGNSELVMIAENGQMAIHLPLSAARIGAFSTHTAHPEFVHLAKEFFSTLLDHRIEVTNPFLYRTKAEVVATIAKRHKAGLADSISCWRGSRVTAANHCGECVPCLVRRIALESNGIKLAEYARDLLKENISALKPEDEGKRNLVELAEFAVAFQRGASVELQLVYPDLFNAYFDMDLAVQMYKRFAVEALGVLAAYPGVRPLLPRSGSDFRKKAKP